MRPEPLVLPWPERTLNPNARVHWAVLSKARKQAKEAAYYLAKQHWPSGSFPEPGRLQLWIDFFPPDRRSRDDDNCLSSFKAHRDGIAQALGIDDKRFVSHPFLKDEVFKGGKVEVRITTTPTEK